MKRVVVTGMGGLSPLGNTPDEMFSSLKECKNKISYLPEWTEYKGIRTLVGGVVDFETPDHYSRKKTRSMGRVAQLATRASELALEDAGLLGSSIVKNGKLGVAYGSSSGSPSALAHFAWLKFNKEMKGITSTSYLQMMSHTCAANISLFFETTGRIVPTSSACTSASQAIGYAAEMIRSGKQDVMIAGGAEELCVTIAAVFDVLYATSVRNDEPSKTPRPFDADRDGLAVAEGAGTLILESYEHAKARGAKIYAELKGFGTNNDGRHITNPYPETMRQAMELALEDSGLKAEQISYINAHATATELGDIAESEATYKLFSNKVPVSSLKSYIGHTLGACGALEVINSISMMDQKWCAPTVNLDNVDPRCADLDFITGVGRDLDIEYFMSNNFAFGGVNTSLIFGKI